MREGWDNFCYFFLEGDGLCFFNGTLMGVVVVCQAIKFGTIFDIFFLVRALTLEKWRLTASKSQLTPDFFSKC